MQLYPGTVTVTFKSVDIYSVIHICAVEEILEKWEYFSLWKIVLFLSVFPTFIASGMPGLAGKTGPLSGKLSTISSHIALV